MKIIKLCINIVRNHLPNALTGFRIILVPCIFFLIIYHKNFFDQEITFVLYALACITDFLDGYFARLFQRYSSFGSMLDPIADKLLVASVILALTFVHVIQGWLIWAALIILCREILVSGLREFLSTIKVSIPVTYLSKWKTFLQMISLGILLLVPVDQTFFTSLITVVGEILLATSAILTVITGFSYFKYGYRHIEI